MADAAKGTAGSRKPGKGSDISWLARLTHPLVFFGAAIAVFEGIIGTALLTGKHSDSTVIWLCAMMAVVILAAIITVAILVFKKPQHLMLTQQDTIGEEIALAHRVHEAARLLVERPKPRTPAELLKLMEDVEVILSGKDM